jgi:4'-phosphopantetheinyl transferase
MNRSVAESTAAGRTVSASAAAEVGSGPQPGPERTQAQVHVLPPLRRCSRSGRSAATLRGRQADALAERQRSRWFRDQVLSAALGVSADDLGFEVEPGGKPHLVKPSRIDFSVSHTTGAVAVVTLLGRAVGIDLERVRPLPARRRIHRAFSATDRAAIDAAGDPDRELLLTWTRKEALLKALGMGLTVPLQGLLDDAVRPAEDVIELLPPGHLDPLARTWSIWSFTPLPGFVGACAVGAPVTSSLPPSVRVHARPTPTALPGPRADARP